MKKYLFIAAIVAAALFSTNRAVAQVNVNININSQPDWGPSGYDYARYYYIPEIDLYYEVASKCYVYFNGNIWIKRYSLPPRYRDFDLYRAYKVIVNERNPWYKNQNYKREYGRFADEHGKQALLRDGRSPQANQDLRNRGGRTENRNGNRSGRQDHKQNDRNDDRDGRQQEGRR